MAIRSLRSRVRPDDLKNQVRAGQSWARRIYLVALLGVTAWIGMQVFGPMLFINADGLIVQEREVVGAAFPAQVTSVSVRPGDAVKAGQLIGTVVSTQMLDIISELTTRQAQAQSRSDQIDARLSAIKAVLPTADHRAARALAALRDLERAMAGGYSTSIRLAEMSRAHYDAARDSADLRAEASALESEKQALKGNLARIATALGNAIQTYSDGAVVASIAGTVGPKVVAAGTVLRPGEAFADIYDGDQYVLAYLPTNRLYPTYVGRSVLITDGVNSEGGKIQRIERITDALPVEFQSSFRSIDRQQLVRVTLDGTSQFPLFSKIKVTSGASALTLISQAWKYLLSQSRPIFATAVNNQQVLSTVVSD